MSHHGNGGIGDSKILLRKIPTNTRYNDIKPRVNTGASMARYEKRVEELQTNNRFKKGELFRRLKTTTLAQLFLQVANVSMQDEDNAISELETTRSLASTANLNRTLSRDTFREDGESAINNNLHEGSELISSRSSLQSVIQGVGEVDVINRNKPECDKPQTPYLYKPYPTCPYILLDVRDEQDFEACHIVGAKNFPIAMLSRTMNSFTKEILDYKNVLGRIIIIYDEDERTARVAATTMVERGFNNIFVLSGGLKALGAKFPEGIVTGSYPFGCNVQNISQASRTCADPKKMRFSAEDLDKINHYLEESLVPKDTGSRLSRLTNNSRYSHTSSSKSSSLVTDLSSRRAWK